MKGSLRLWTGHSTRWVSVRSAGLVVVAALTLVGCGGKSIPAPESAKQLESNVFITYHGSYKPVLTATGRGNRRFTAVSLSGHVGVQMSCRGGSSAQLRLAGEPAVRANCSLGLSAGGTKTIAPTTRVTIVATHDTRWSLVLEDRPR